MKVITATELARNLSQVLDKLGPKGEEIIVERNHRQVARIVPGRACQTALEAMADLYQTLPDRAGDDWLADSRAQPVGDETPLSIRGSISTDLLSMAVEALLTEVARLVPTAPSASAERE